MCASSFVIISCFPQIQCGQCIFYQKMWGGETGITGQHILALHSGVPNVSVGELHIISPADHNRAVLKWDRDKLRRAGKTGSLVFIEIGRRCEGGPGLVWMCVGLQDDAVALRRTLHRYTNNPCA